MNLIELGIGFAIADLCSILDHQNISEVLSDSGVIRGEYQNSRVTTTVEFYTL